MITARATYPSAPPANDPGLHPIVLTLKRDGVPIAEHRSQINGSTEDAKILSARWQAIANALIASGLQVCDQMAREAWFASICLPDGRVDRYTIDRARGIVASHIGPDKLQEIYQQAA